MELELLGMEQCGLLSEMGQIQSLIRIMELIGLVLERIFLLGEVNFLGMEQYGLQLVLEQIQLLIHIMELYGLD
ncbi:MAG: hypothetical protein EBR59_09920 [Methylococcaceae bacterium]|nr:hypothetical protein [Methylococcaceae bacterium]